MQLSTALAGQQLRFEQTDELKWLCYNQSSSRMTFRIGDSSLPVNAAQRSLQMQQLMPIATAMFMSISI